MGAIDTTSRLVWQNINKHEPGNVSMAGFIRHSPGIGWDKMRVLGRYAVVYVHEGAGVYRDARGADLAVTAGDLLVVYPDVAHCYGPLPGQKWSEFYLVFEGAVFDAWRRSAALAPPRVRLHLEPVDFWLRRWLDVVAISRDPLQPMARLQMVLADALAAEHVAAAQTGDLAWLERAQRLLADAAHWRADMPAIADKVGLSYETFRKKFAALAGESPARYRMVQVIQHACRLLHEPGMSNADVAEACGFCDEFHFSRRFKQLMGVSPSGFRKMLPVRGATKKPA